MKQLYSPFWRFGFWAILTAWVPSFTDQVIEGSYYCAAHPWIASLAKATFFPMQVLLMMAGFNMILWIVTTSVFTWLAPVYKAFKVVELGSFAAGISVGNDAEQLAKATDAQWSRDNANISREHGGAKLDLPDRLRSDLLDRVGIDGREVYNDDLWIRRNEVILKHGGVETVIGDVDFRGDIYLVGDKRGRTPFAAINQAGEFKANDGQVGYALGTGETVQVRRERARISENVLAQAGWDIFVRSLRVLAPRSELMFFVAWAIIIGAALIPLAVTPKVWPTVQRSICSVDAQEGADRENDGAIGREKPGGTDSTSSYETASENPTGAPQNGGLASGEKNIRYIVASSIHLRAAPDAKSRSITRAPIGAACIQKGDAETHDGEAWVFLSCGSTSGYTKSEFVSNIAPTPESLAEAVSTAADDKTKFAALERLLTLTPSRREYIPVARATFGRLELSLLERIRLNPARRKAKELPTTCNSNDDRCIAISLGGTPDDFIARSGASFDIVVWHANQTATEYMGTFSRSGPLIVENQIEYSDPSPAFRTIFGPH